jgi:hypothetical protein
MGNFATWGQVRLFGVMPVLRRKRRKPSPLAMFGLIGMQATLALRQGRKCSPIHADVARMRLVAVAALNLNSKRYDD